MQPSLSPLSLPSSAPSTLSHSLTLTDPTWLRPGQENFAAGGSRHLDQRGGCSRHLHQWGGCSFAESEAAARGGNSTATICCGSLGDHTMLWRAALRCGARGTAGSPRQRLLQTLKRTDAALSVLSRRLPHGRRGAGSGAGVALCCSCCSSGRRLSRCRARRLQLGCAR
eukprot:359605-Chlamydomonas_euryale.AAC.4